MKDIKLLADAAKTAAGGWKPTASCNGRTVWIGKTTYKQRTAAVDAAERSIQRFLASQIGRYEEVLEKAECRG